MKIAINGQIIDTEHIWKIDPVVGNNCWSADNANTDRNKLTDSGYEFKIHFFNSRYLCITNDGDDYFPKDWWYCYQENYNEYLDKLSHTKKQLEDFRERIIAIWAENQSPIPQFNI